MTSRYLAMLRKLAKDAVIDDGRRYDVDIAKIGGCEGACLDFCLENCDGYYSCESVALANDILVVYEDEELSECAV